MKKTGKNLTILQEVDSTNNYANRLIMTDSAEEGAVVLAYYQKKGKGQAGNYWESELGKNLLISIILFPVFLPAEKQFYLSKITSLAILDFLAHKISDLSIKWPNDIYVGDKKIAGILIENSVKGSVLNSAVLGMGININQKKFSDTLPNPVSLAQLSGNSYNIEKLSEKLTDNILDWYARLKNHKLQEIDQRYIDNLYRFNEWSNFKEGDKVFKARITGVGSLGHLLLEKENGEQASYAFKEVEFLK